MSERDEQVAVIEWWAYACKRYKLPEFALFAIPNGGHRHPAVGAKMKAEGVRRGVYDLFLAVPVGVFHGLFIEMKFGSNDLTVEQGRFGEHAAAHGYRVVTCWDSQDATMNIEEYMKVRA